ncbi:MAG TPA: glutamine--fructose-6-phosphate transaminase (isomerizing) [Patescibacteria group bacterium]
MCGIISYKGQQPAPKIILAGLKKLEYRGYDSWGIAVKDQEINLLKKIGKVGEIEAKDLDFKSQGDQIAIGHSRWATTGKVTEANAHPHLSNNKKIALVQNGIVENYLTLKKELQAKGYIFNSETDTEVIVNLIQEYNRKNDFVQAVRKAFNRLTGRNAIVAIHQDNNLIVGARLGSPLIVGIGDNEYFLASDIPAFLNYTRRVNYLDDGELVVIDQSPRFFSLKTGQEILKRLIEIDWQADQAEKGDYRHFMIKEIMEQKETIRRAVEQDEKAILKIARDIKNAFGTFLVGAGTAGKVCFTGDYFFSKIAGEHTNFVPASEFINYSHFLTPKSLMVVVSQSGETADVLEAMEIAKAKGVKIISLVNVQGSSIMRQSDYSLLIKAGPEQAVASTKATTAQMSILALLAYAINDQLARGKTNLVALAGKVNDMLNPRYEDHIRQLAEKIHKHESMYIIGRGVNYPMALECAIKLQEVSYIHAEGFAGGELKHGPIALIGEGTPLITLVANDENRESILSNAQEVKSRGGYIIGVSPFPSDVFDYWIKVPEVGPLSPIVNIIPVQILAYHLGVLKGNDPDKPRNLAKSVTVK